jgi:hypothetical protein
LITRSSPFLGMGKDFGGTVGPGDGEVWAQAMLARSAQAPIAATRFANRLLHSSARLAITLPRFSIVWCT